MSETMGVSAVGSRPRLQREPLKGIADGYQPLDDLLTVIMPAYNEAERIAASIAETSATLDGLGWDYELIVVDDGSTDGTYECAEKQATAHYNDPQTSSASGPGTASAPMPPRIRVLRLGRNCGKGMALRYGLVYARGQLIAFLDSDLDLRPTLLPKLVQRMIESKSDVVAGSKWHPRSIVKYPLLRKIVSACYAIFVKTLFRLPVNDTQTGVKLFRREVLEQVFPRILIKRYALDLELLVNAHHLGFAMVDAPVELLFQRSRGRISMRDAWHVWLDTLAIFYRLNIVRYYDRLGQPVYPLSPNSQHSNVSSQP